MSYGNYKSIFANKSEDSNISGSTLVANDFKSLFNGSATLLFQQNLKKEVDSESTSSPLGLIALISIIVFVTLIVMVGTIKYAKKQSTANEEDTEMQSLQSPTLPSPSMNFAHFRQPPSQDTPTSSSSRAISAHPTTPKRRRTTAPLSELIKDLYFLIEDNNHDAIIAEVSDRDMFMGCKNDIYQRVDLDINDEIEFINDKNDKETGTILFKGSKAEVEAFAESLEFPAENEDDMFGNENGNVNDVEARLGIVEARITHLEKQVERLELQSNTTLGNFRNQLLALQNRRAAQPGSSAVNTPRDTLFETTVNGQNVKIRDLLDIPAALKKKVEAFQRLAEPVICGARGDIRQKLFQHQDFFINNYHKPSACGGFIINFLVGPEVWKKGFLPNPFYFRGPAKRGGEMKSAFSYSTTVTFYKCLDLVIANIFTPSHRLIFIEKARTYVNDAVDTLKHHVTRLGKDFGVKPFNDGYVFSEAQALVSNFAEEKKSHTKDISETHQWFGKSSESTAEEELLLEDGEGHDEE